ncbi:hypothetical protein LNQ52_16670 [Klebsiella pneumoniae subsp. pneumoniae]|nr:hypothetical protein [Klebsiella pneumoniae subsp. pneumoniae]
MILPRRQGAELWSGRCGEMRKRDGAGGTEAVADGRLQSWNSNKDSRRQRRPWLNPWSRRSKDGNRSIIGLMIESVISTKAIIPLNSTREAIFKYGVPVTDACISWETTEALLRNWIRISAATWRPVCLRGKYGC